jgi:hypothetical protein
MFGNYAFVKNWGLQFFGFYRSPQVQLQGSQGNFFFYSASVRRDFANKKGSIGIGAEQFLTPVMRIENSTKSQNITQKSTNEMYNMNFRITFSYRIGKMSFDAPRRRKKSINNDDLKDGGDGGGGGGDTQAAAAPAGGGQRPATAVAPAMATSKPGTSAPTAPTDPTAVVDPEGTWSYTVESPQGGGGTLRLKKDGDKYTGVIVSSRNNKEVPLTSVTLAGNELTYTYEMSFGPNTTTIVVKSIVEGDVMTGTMTLGQFGSFPVKAKRAP